MSVSQREGIRGPHRFSLKQWWSVAKNIAHTVQSNNLSLVAAGVAFYFLLAVFPLFAGVISLYGLLISPAELTQHMNFLISVLPQDSRFMLEQQLLKLIEKSDQALSFSLVVSVALTVWGGSKGAQALLIACNISYRESENRSFLSALVARIVLTLSTIAVIIFALLLITFLPELITLVFGDIMPSFVTDWLSWLLLMVIFNLGLATLYRYGPHRRAPKWRWVSLGSVVATLLWLIASYGFSEYVSEYASYNQTYGSMGSIVILLMWFYLSAFIILLGAAMNASLEFHTEGDSTIGPDRPIGKRGAYVADNTPHE
ncbi:YihY/virulence factor BrkB family protein [Alteromonas sp. SM 2104]|nr:YihY/virulence factor BrkB family protein [Alteromonas oceanisediminis]